MYTFSENYVPIVHNNVWRYCCILVLDGVKVTHCLLPTGVNGLRRKSEISWLFSMFSDSDLSFFQCFEALSGRKDIQPVRNVHHLSPKVPFRTKWRKKVKETTSDPCSIGNWPLS